MFEERKRKERLLQDECRVPLRSHSDLARQASLSTFLQGLFSASDIIEVRAIESWKENGRKESCVLKRMWLTAGEVMEAQEELWHLNERGGNIYFGVSPRTNRKSQAVQKVTCLWADLDGVSPNEALLRVSPLLPAPTIVVNSGNGTHLYWKLTSSHTVIKDKERVSFEGLLRNLYSEIGGDSVSDLTRLMRLPSFLNCKNARNGKVPTSCTLVDMNANSYALSDFSRWMHRGDDNLKSLALPCLARIPSDVRTQKRIEGLLRYLDTETGDRSRRDFGVVCGLLRLGVSKEEIFNLVLGHSKANENPKYLIRTIQNACRALGME